MDGAPDEERDPYEGKDPTAVELGWLGGQNGGKGRAANLTSEEWSQIAKRAAAARRKASSDQPSEYENPGHKGRGGYRIIVPRVHLSKPGPDLLHQPAGLEYRPQGSGS